MPPRSRLRFATACSGLPRILAILALALCLAVATAAPASAHPRFTPLSVEPGKPVTLSMQVDSHFDTALTSVTLRIPPAFTLDKVVAAPGWTQQPSTVGQPIRFTGRLVPGAFASFVVSGTPEAKGIIHFPVTTASDAGETTNWIGECDTDAPFKAAFLFSGVVEDCEAADDSGGLPLLPVGIFLIVAGIGGLVGYTLVTRRR